MAHGEQEPLFETPESKFVDGFEMLLAKLEREHEHVRGLLPPTRTPLQAALNSQKELMAGLVGLWEEIASYVVHSPLDLLFDFQAQCLRMAGFDLPDETEEDLLSQAGIAPSAKIRFTTYSAEIEQAKAVFLVFPQKNTVELMPQAQVTYTRCGKRIVRTLSLGIAKNTDISVEPVVKSVASF